MIDPDQENLLRNDEPEKPKEDPEVVRRRNEENLRWLEENMGFRPFGVEW